ncbi:hypothetical protein [Kitasatospora sp. NPDC059571]|uniref:hypothetical protein n=1 Tax=Kitasatospora sp. NPDC059571 TaxID=3346871 RepID=UPI0036CC90EC
MSGPRDAEFTVWALTVDEDSPGAPVAEVYVEVGRRWHGDLLADAIDSGFHLAVGEPPDSTGLLLTSGAEIERLLVGGRRSWEPLPHPLASPQWWAAARSAGHVLVTLVPPGTWQGGPVATGADEEPGEHPRGVATACGTAVVLHGTARLAVR